MALSDHKLFLSTRKNYRAKKGTHKHIKLRSFKEYWAEQTEDTLTSTSFSNNQNLDDTTEIYNDFIQKIMLVIKKVASIKEIRIKRNCQEGFDEEVSEAIKSESLK